MISKLAESKAMFSPLTSMASFLSFPLKIIVAVERYDTVSSFPINSGYKKLITNNYAFPADV